MSGLTDRRSASGSERALTPFHVPGGPMTSSVTDVLPAPGRIATAVELPVLYDPDGRRRRWMGWAGRGIVFVFVAWLAALVLAGLGVAPLANLPLIGQLQPLPGLRSLAGSPSVASPSAADLAAAIPLAPNGTGTTSSGSGVDRAVAKRSPGPGGKASPTHPPKSGSGTQPTPSQPTPATAPSQPGQPSPGSPRSGITTPVDTTPAVSAASHAPVIPNRAADRSADPGAPAATPTTPSAQPPSSPAVPPPPSPH